MRKWPLKSDVQISFNGLFTLARFVSITVSDSDMQQSHDCTCLGHLRWRNIIRNDPISVASPKVAKASK